MSTTTEHYRSDGVRITHDPDAPGMASKYGSRGETDPEGFDPYADTVGAGIYGGNVKRGANGEVLYGQQYQSHNSRPGPIYAGTGYSEMSKALGDDAAVLALLERDPSMVHDISTGGATPLHMCGMSRRNQHSSALLISRGADVEAEDTYEFRPLHRMASNNLAVGARALIEAGAEVNARAGGATPLAIAWQARARDVIQLLKAAGGTM